MCLQETSDLCLCVSLQLDMHMSNTRFQRQSSSQLFWSLTFSLWTVRELISVVRATQSVPTIPFWFLWGRQVMIFYFTFLILVFFSYFSHWGSERWLNFAALCGLFLISMYPQQFPGLPFILACLFNCPFQLYLLIFRPFFFLYISSFKDL